MITRKHRGKILAFFDNFVISANQSRRIRVRNIQKMLGLQIWVSTVFRITRQFLTSLCDVLRLVQTSHNKSNKTWFHPRKCKGLVNRVLFDLKFWRRFVLNTPTISFNYLLNRLPRNDCLLYSDASSSHGMGGVLLFGKSIRRLHQVDGIFWQLTWQEWQAIRSMSDFHPGKVKISRAEFLAALVTCETFIEYCEKKLTTLALDNNAAKCWFDSARCPIYPLDRSAQGVGLFMLEREMKVITKWISSQENAFADICSRKTFLSKRKRQVYNIAGAMLRKVPPRWGNVLKLI